MRFSANVAQNGLNANHLLQNVRTKTQMRRAAANSVPAFAAALRMNTRLSRQQDQQAAAGFAFHQFPCFYLSGNGGRKGHVAAAALIPV